MSEFYDEARKSADDLLGPFLGNIDGRLFLTRKRTITISKIIELYKNKDLLILDEGLRFIYRKIRFHELNECRLSKFDFLYLIESNIKGYNKDYHECYGSEQPVYFVFNNDTRNIFVKDTGFVSFIIYFVLFKARVILDCENINSEEPIYFCFDEFSEELKERLLGLLISFELRYENNCFFMYGF